MKKLLILIAALCGMAACGNSPKQQSAETPQPDRIEVLAFHGKQRCVTCVSIEEQAREVVESNFEQQTAIGAVVFRIVDITQAENEALADKYEVAWSSLLLVKRMKGNENVNDLTKFAFANARSNPERFKSELKAEIAKLLDE